jgi:polysaccharide pyruvyl transferase WcaK-like protein
MAAYFFARTQFENLGDRGIALALLREIAQYQPLRIIAMNCPADYCQQLARVPNSTLLYNPMQALRLLLHDLSAGNSIFLAMKPGHLFGDRRQLTKYLLQLLMLMLFKLLGARIVRLGASIGPLSRIIEPIEALSSKLYTHYSVRESLSFAYVRSIGCTNPKHFPDLGFLFEPEFLDPLDKPEIAAKPRNFLAVSTREYERAEHKSTAARAIKELMLTRPDMELRFVAQVQFDVDSIRNLRAHFKRTTDTSIEWRGTDVNHLFSVYQATTFVLSNRLHVLLFAAKLGAIPVALISRVRDTKIVGIFLDCGLEDLLLDLDDPPSIKSYIQRIVHNEQYYRQLVNQVFESNREDAKQKCKQLFSQ